MDGYFYLNTAFYQMRMYMTSKFVLRTLNASKSNSYQILLLFFVTIGYLNTIFIKNINNYLMAIQNSSLCEHLLVLI